MKRRKKIKTENQLAFERERRRIKAAIRRYEKKGYIFDKKTIENLIKKPKRITKKSIENLKEITPRRILKYSEVLIDETTGELMGGYQYYINSKKKKKNNAIELNAEENIDRGYDRVEEFAEIWYEAMVENGRLQFAERFKSLINKYKPQNYIFRPWYKKYSRQFLPALQQMTYDSDQEKIEMGWNTLIDCVEKTQMTLIDYVPGNEKAKRLQTFLDFNKTGLDIERDGLIY